MNQIQIPHHMLLSLGTCMLQSVYRASAVYNLKVIGSNPSQAITVVLLATDWYPGSPYLGIPKVNLSKCPYFACFNYYQL